jgi:putative transposase
MALPQSAVSDLLELLRTGEAIDLIRESAPTVLQKLVEAEAAEVIGAARYERTDTRVNERNGSRPARCPRRPVTSICGSRSCARARSSR